MAQGERRIDRERIERAARMYSTNEDASRALGIEPRSFSRLCRRYGVETPYARRLRERRDARQGRKGPPPDRPKLA